ncbi:Peptidoglycan DL-endopeptidase CwlO [Bacillus rhizoplanae]|uniref:Peptidoglycan DL-endopeptidase CwlO n=1 Tax=Bacillus rhizoplanae TaxID=2880966 RepID=A0ABM8Y8V6_9BACI|nr:Peptidoglycan DL-endopeptidase CwlO [Bacillus rhizoplanae]
MFSVVTPNAFAEKNDDVKTQIQQQNDTLHNQQQERDGIQKQMDELNKKITDMDKSVQENEAKIAETKKQIEETQKLIDQKDKEIADLQTKIAQREELLKKRLVALQEKPNTNVVTEVVVNSTSFADLLDRLTSVSQILQSDQDIMKMQQQDQDKVKKDVDLVKAKQAELKDAQAKIEATQKDLDAQKAQQQTAANDLSAKMQTVVSSMTSTEGQLKDLEQQALVLQRISEQQAAAAAPAQAPAPAQAQAKAPQSGGNGGGQTAQPKQQPENTGGVVEKAKSLVGMKYVWGSSSPSNGGFDCSGLVSYVYGLGHQTTSSLWASVQKISPSEAQPGDLIFLQGTYRPGVSHVGIYIGNGQMIHAADESTGVTYGNVNSSYNQAHFLGYGRL